MRHWILQAGQLENLMLEGEMSSFGVSAFRLLPGLLTFTICSEPLFPPFLWAWPSIITDSGFIGEWAQDFPGKESERHNVIMGTTAETLRINSFLN